MPAKSYAGKSYAYVIVGAGSAGCTLANRLSEDSDASALVLGASGCDRDPWIKIPLGWGRILRVDAIVTAAAPEPTARLGRLS